MVESETGDTKLSEWDAEWAGISEMRIGSESGFEEFVERVSKKMEELGNEVGRPLVMKATIQVHAGELKRPVVERTTFTKNDREEGQHGD